MKKSLSILVILLLAVTTWAQNPKLNYQAVVRDSQNKLVTEQPVTVTVNVLKNDNTPLFEQTLNANTNRNGLLSLEIGDATAAWSNIDWTDAKIRTAVALSNGTQWVDTTNVTVVPLALYANSVSLDAIPQSDWAETDNSKCTFILNKPNIADTVNNILTNGQYVTEATMNATIQDLLDRIAELEQANSIPSVITSTPAPNGDGIALTGGVILMEGSSNVTSRGICWSTSENPTISGNHTSDGAGIGSFTTLVNGLASNTTYYFRAYAINTAGIAYGLQESYTTPVACNDLVVTDADNNTYHAVLIGTQCWMKENLKTTKYADGTSIERGVSDSYKVAYWYYPQNESSNKETYGLMYNWKAMMRNASSTNSNPSNVQGICPEGWHVPSNAEWYQLHNYVSSQSDYYCNGNTANIAKALASTTGWANYTESSVDQDCFPGYNPDDNNNTGFSALAAGYYEKVSTIPPYPGGYSYITDDDLENWHYSIPDPEEGNTFGVCGIYAYFWTATQTSDSNANCRRMKYSLADEYNHVLSKNHAFSVRCLRN